MLHRCQFKSDNYKQKLTEKFKFGELFLFIISWIFAVQHINNTQTNNRKLNQKIIIEINLEVDGLKSCWKNICEREWSGI